MIFFLRAFSGTWCHRGEKIHTSSPLKVRNRFTPKNSLIPLYQRCSKNCEIAHFVFLTFFFIYLAWNDIGVKLSDDIFLESTHLIHCPKIHILLKRVSTKVAKRIEV